MSCLETLVSISTSLGSFNVSSDEKGCQMAWSWVEMTRRVCAIRSFSEVSLVEMGTVAKTGSAVSSCLCKTSRS